MTERAVTEDVPESVREAQERFDAGMGADGDRACAWTRMHPNLSSPACTSARHPASMWCGTELGRNPESRTYIEYFLEDRLRHAERLRR